MCPGSLFAIEVQMSCQHHPSHQCPCSDIYAALFTYKNFMYAICTKKYSSYSSVRGNFQNANMENNKKTFSLTRRWLWLFLTLDSVPKVWEILRAVQSILPVSNSVLFWIEISDVAPGICWSYFLNLGIVGSKSSNYYCNYLGLYFPYLLYFFIQLLVFL